MVTENVTDNNYFTENLTLINIKHNSSGKNSMDQKPQKTTLHPDNSDINPSTPKRRAQFLFL